MIVNSSEFKLAATTIKKIKTNPSKCLQALLNDLGKQINALLGNEKKR